MLNNKHISYTIIIIQFLFSITLGQEVSKKEMRRIHAKIDRVRVQVDSLQLDNQILLPELMAAFKQAVKSKAQQDSVTLLVLKKINTLDNRISKIESKSNSRDSTNLEILNKLMLIENKVVTLNKGYSEMYELASDDKNISEPKFNNSQYTKLYTESLGSLQNNIYEPAIKGFQRLVKEDHTHDLADNAQYWLAECFYSQKDYKRAIIEFEKVFTFINTNKNDDAQYKIALSYQSIGNVPKARSEFQRLIEYFPGSEFYQQAKAALKALPIN